MKKYKKPAVLHQPEGQDLFAELAPYDTEMIEGQCDLVFAFVLDMESLQALVRQVIEGGLLQRGGYLYAAYPKTGNKVYPTSIHRDHLFEGLGADEEGYIGTSSLKFARMAGLNDVFTVVGFKEEARKEAKSSSPKPSQLADDYIGIIPEVERDLRDAPEALAFYRSLSPGYRKDWARYVYSAVQEDTRAKRREDMKMMLQAGYKSVALYRKGTE